MAGSHPAFNPDTFRTNIRFAMNMGLPNATNERATFRWTPQTTYSHHDSAGVTFDFASTPLSVTAHADVNIPVAWEFQALRTQAGDNVVGQFDTSQVIITVLDEDYDQVRSADLVVMGGNTYDIEYVAPPIGLFEVTVYQIYARARDES